MKGIEIIEHEFLEGYAVIRPDGITMYDCTLCMNHKQINKIQFYLHFSMEDDGRRIAAITHIRNPNNKN